jgi:hypothetical protein
MMDSDIQPVTLTDPHQVPDIFADGLGPIECVAGDYNRYVLYASNRGGGLDEHIVVARIIIPKVAVPVILMLAARQLGLSLVRRVWFIGGTIH